MRRTQTSANRANLYNIAWMGDSQTDASAAYVPLGYLSSYVLEQYLSAAGALATVRNFGKSGDTTGDMLARFDVMQQYPQKFPAVNTPQDLYILYGGVNDDYNAITISSITQTGGTATVTTASAHRLFTGFMGTITGASQAGYNLSGFTVLSTPTSTTFTYAVNSGTVSPATGSPVLQPGTAVNTQACVEAMLLALKFNAMGSGAGQGAGVAVGTPAELPFGGRPGQRYVVLYDNDATGGVVATETTLQHTTITGSGGNGHTVWEYRTPRAGVAGWGRVANATTAPFQVGVRVIVLDTNYLNFSASGDSYNTATSIGSQYAKNVTIRTAIGAAVTAQKVASGTSGIVLASLYAMQSQRIYGANPEFAQGDHLWHIIDSNQHHNAAGHELVARHVFDTIIAQGWLAALSA